MLEKELTSKVLESVRLKAQSIGVSVQEYLDGAKSRFCVLVNNSENCVVKPHLFGRILCSKDDEYCDYDDIRVAKNAIYFLGIDAEIISESDAISKMVLNEQRESVSIAGFTISQVNANELEIRLSDCLSGSIGVLPVVANVIKVIKVVS